MRKSNGMPTDGAIERNMGMLRARQEVFIYVASEGDPAERGRKRICFLENDVTDAGLRMAMPIQGAFENPLVHLEVVTSVWDSEKSNPDENPYDSQST